MLLLKTNPMQAAHFIQTWHIQNEASARIHTLDYAHVLLRQNEIVHIIILADAFLMNRFRNRNDLTLPQPAENHLCGSLAIFLSDANSGF